MDENKLIFGLLYTGIISFCLGCAVFVLPSFIPIKYEIVVAISLLILSFQKIHQSLFLKLFEPNGINKVLSIILIIISIYLLQETKISHGNFNILVSAFMILLGLLRFIQSLKLKALPKFRWIYSFCSFSEFICGLLLMIGSSFFSNWVMGLFIGSCLIIVGASSIAFYILFFE